MRPWPRIRSCRPPGPIFCPGNGPWTGSEGLEFLAKGRFLNCLPRKQSPVCEFPKGKRSTQTIHAHAFVKTNALPGNALANFIESLTNFPLQSIVIPRSSLCQADIYALNIGSVLPGNSGSIEKPRLHARISAGCGRRYLILNFLPISIISVKLRISQWNLKFKFKNFLSEAPCLRSRTGPWNEEKIPWIDASQGDRECPPPLAGG